MDLQMTKILKEINKGNEKNPIITVGVDKTNKTKFSFGTPSIDFTTYNSVPEGAWIEISGAEGSGKTLLSFLIAADFIRKEKKKAEEERRNILFVDAEGTMDSEWAMTSAGYDTEDTEVKTYHMLSMGQSAEQLFDKVRICVQTGEVGLVIFDSLTAIAPQQVNEESFEKKEMGGIAKPLADFVKRCTGLFNRYRTTFIGIMGLIMNIGGYGLTETTPGGTYFRRACSLRIRVKKGMYCGEDWSEKKSSEANPAGYIMETCIMKSKFCRMDRRLGQCHINYRTGVDVLMDTIDVAINVGLIDSSKQGYFKLVNPQTGEILKDEDCGDITFHGKKAIKPYLESHPDIWKNLYDAVYEKISIKNETNIKSFEEVLNRNVADQFGNDVDNDIDNGGQYG